MVMTELKMCLTQVDITKPGVTSFEVEGGTFTVDVFDSASDYVKLLK